MDEAPQRLARHAAEGALLREVFFSAAAPLVLEAARTVSLALAQGRRVYAVAEEEAQGQAERWAELFMHGYLVERPPLPMLALRPVEAYGFGSQIQCLGLPGDVLVVICAQGMTPHLAEATELAREQKMFTLALAGNDADTGCHLTLAVPHVSLPLVRETHLALMHSLCGLVDYYLFENVGALGLV